MKTLISFLTVTLTLATNAQTTSIKDIKSDDDTTISIKKGNQGIGEKAYEIVEGGGEIEGDPNVLTKAAREEWKKSCDNWKKEIKDLNKDNQVLSITCNAPNCKAETSGTICKSTGAYKLKVKVTK